MKEKLVALLVVSVMVASAFGATGLSATKVGAAGETLTLFASNANPAPGQQYTLSGVLTDNTGTGLAYKPIEIFYYLNEGWHFSNTVYAGADGTYSTTVTSSKPVYLYTAFPGDSGYVPSISRHVFINVTP